MKMLVSAKSKILCAAFSVASLIASPGWAATRTVKLSVPDMNCAACPITVKKALSRVDGVRQISVSLEKREAVVAFDDAKTDIRHLTEATESAGYPSTLKK